VSPFNIIIAPVVVANSLHTGQDAENWTNFSAVTWSYSKQTNQLKAAELFCRRHKISHLL